jgi:hypothetical protein
LPDDLDSAFSAPRIRAACGEKSPRLVLAGAALGRWKALLLDEARTHQADSEKEAKTSTVWHSCCSTAIFDITTLSHLVGKNSAPGLMVLCMDSDSNSGLCHCSLRTLTLEAALEAIPVRFRFGPGDVSSLADSMRTAFQAHANWLHAATRGVVAMKDRFIDEMHKIRAERIAKLRDAHGLNSEA